MMHPAGRWFSRWKSFLLRRVTDPPRSGAAAAQQPSAAASVQGSAKGWLRVLGAEQLLLHLRASACLDAMWRQSRLCEPVWKRDLLTAINRYAEFVQLMPA